MTSGFGSITDVAGILVGHHHRCDSDATVGSADQPGSGWACGTTVVLAPPGTVGSVDVRGGAPGSRETEVLHPSNTVRYVDAVVLTGGSAYGLAAADGVMTWLAEQCRGVAMTGGTVPIVPAAVIFDLPVGAGVGARAGVLKGGVGTASTVLDNGVTVGAIVVVNCAGEVADTATGLPWMAEAAAELGLSAPTADRIAAYAARHRESSPLNTTIAVIATDAALSKAACHRVAIAAQDGLARTIQPVHTPLDGDTVFALATGAVQVPPSDDTPAAMSPETALTTAVGIAAADCLARAVLTGVLAAEPVAGIPTYRDVLVGGEPA
ncbi:P1 family peptidase [Mycolicibacterium sp.]|uniref:P1 family peptidase n=1 Tax=Mycolicibacterium sp. TaxID=2320850 RepID=UPI0028AF3A98|nr:P1 family peptidase [Mycolicibacterium sp.]